MSQELLDYVGQKSMKEEIPNLRVGDTVDVKTRIVEGEKERVQIFNGTIIAIRGRGVNSNFTVRRLVGKQGVERTFVLHSPNVLDVVSKRKGKVRRAKLYYLRDRIGKARRLKEVRRVSESRDKAKKLA